MKKTLLRRNKLTCTESTPLIVFYAERLYVYFGKRNLALVLAELCNRISGALVRMILVDLEEF